MPTRLLLEGHDLEALLAQVKKEHGPAAKIVSADRVRAAGLAGLFSRQRYELTVEVADKAEPAGAGAAGGPTPPRTVPPTPPPEAASSTRAKAPPNPAAHFQAGLPSATLAYQANLAAAATGGTAGTAPAGPNGTTPAMMTVTPTDRSEPPAADSTATVPVPAGPATGATGASPADELVALVEERERRQTPYVGPDETASVNTAMRAAEQVSAEAAAFADVLSEYGIPGWRTPANEGVMPSPQPESEQVVAVFQAPQPTPGPTIQPPSEGTLIPRYRPVVLPADSPLVNVLTHLGMPKELCDRVTGFDSYRAIVKVLKLLPGPPQAPAGAGDVLLIVGELTGAVATARVVAESLELTVDRTLLAADSVAGTGIHTSRRLTGPEQAAKRIAKVREETNMPLIVVVDAPPGNTGSARSIVEGVPATAVWGVVDATRKTADSARHLADIGHVDAIVVQGTGSTGDPATVLALGVPVALIDGVAPTPHLWADLLCRRLEEVVAE